ncbi:MAG: hypothetical protein H6765_03935 [Candidatus Peribacteria bacterium]|nr:MAG: hypothetical protein H6765_03935 [Candidatus Peribacteria bacterium]
MKKAWTYKIGKWQTRVLLAALLVLVLPGLTYAADSEFSQELYDAVKWILDFLAWAWIIPASIAGKLLTNDFIYASAFHLDRYLWRIWQFMRTLSMFAVGVLFVASILKYFFSGDIKKFLDIL